MLFFDDNDIISQVRLRLKLSEYESKKEYYQEKISEVERDHQELTTNKELLEKFAREKYLMKKPTEDIFIIHMDYPRFIINLKYDEVEFLEEAEDLDEAELNAEMEGLIEQANAFYDREMELYEKE